MGLYNPGVIVQACNPSTQGIKVGGTGGAWGAVLVIICVVLKIPGSQSTKESQEGLPFSPLEYLEPPRWL